jgi:hypothetical protein
MNINHENKTNCIDCGHEKKYHFRRFHKLTLSDKICPIFGEIHSEDEVHSYRYFLITDAGYAYMMCTHKNCANKMFPEDGIKIPDQELKEMFPNEQDI